MDKVATEMRMAKITNIKNGFRAPLHAPNFIKMFGFRISVLPRQNLKILRFASAERTATVLELL